MRVAEERCLEGRGTEVAGCPDSREASGSEMGLDSRSPRLRALLSPWRIPEPVPAPHNQSPLPPVKLPN